ncbi:MAG TPA: (Fe-S)-binding protein, partial [Polyangiaceae bacterium]|nr:(Fe-S)-binding protein [Polyangiaceae bacterium]
MDWNTILISTGTLGGIGAAAAALLAGASRVLRVEEDPRIEQVTEALPGANCGGCGFPGCAGF